MGSLYSAYDGYVLPALEGWGLTQMEAVACGIKPIVLDFGGVKDFLSESNAYFVETTDWMQAPVDPVFTFIKPYMKWKLPKKKSLAEKLRQAYDEKIKLPKNYCDIFRSNWSWDNSAELFLKAVKEYVHK
jgi:glycosyltransferase involved in cell wall biosynthesis